MGWKPLKENLSFFFLLQPFYVLSITALTLLLPLSFLLLSRLSISHVPTQIPFLLSLLFSTNPSLLHILISIITILSLFQTLTGRVGFLQANPGRPVLYAAWVFLCAVQVCVVFGTQAAPEGGSGSGSKKSWSVGLVSRAVFFVGVHEAMMCWSRVVVRPVVDDAVWGRARPEKWAERVAMTAGCGCLWWLRLRDEVDALAGAAVAHFVGWWLYYLTVSIGITRILKGTFWVVMVVLFRRSGDSTMSLNVDLEEQDDRNFVV